jgi:hypothetical protein
VATYKEVRAMFDLTDETTFRLTSTDLRAVWNDRQEEPKVVSWLERVMRRPVATPPAAA